MATNKKSKTSPNTTIAATYQASNSSEIIVNNDDLLTQILVKLPLKSLAKFRSVSKQWHSLISDPEFTRRLIPFPTSGFGLFMVSLSGSGYDFIDLKQIPNSANAPIRSNNPSQIRIIHSCNGLFLFSANKELEPQGNYVYNPSTNKYTLLPPLLPLRPMSVWGLILAFDPSKSSHYKVVCVWSIETVWGLYQIEVYSSKTGTWRLCRYSFKASDLTEFENGVFWNGAVHWVSTEGSSLYFNVDEERLRQMPLPPVPEDDLFPCFRYFGESRGHLHLIYDLENSNALELVVYEMQMDYSSWFVKFRVDCSEFPAAFPEIIPEIFYDQLNISRYLFSIVYVVGGDDDDDEESYAVIRIPGKVIRYSFKSKAFDKLCNIDDGFKPDSLSSWYYTHPYIESLALV